MSSLKSMIAGAILAFASCGCSFASGDVAVCSPDSSGHCIIPNADGSINTTGTFSATVSQFAPNGSTANISSVTSTSSSVALPTGTNVIVNNSGTKAVYVKLGNSGVTATTTDAIIQPLSSLPMTVGSNTYLAAITSGSDVSSINIVGGAGLATGWGGGGSSGGGSGGDVNLTGINGSTPATGNGTTNAGTQRVTISSDSTGKVGITSGSVVGIDQTTPGVTNAVSDSGVESNTASIAASVTGVAQDSTLTGQQTTQSGTVGVKSYIYDPATGAPISYATANTVQGDTAAGSTATENPLFNGCRVATTTPTARSDGQKVGFMCSAYGKLVYDPYAPSSFWVRGSTSSTDTSAHTLLSAAGVGVKNYVTGLQCSNTSATTVTVTLSTASSPVFIVPAGGGNNSSFDVPLATATNTAVTFTSSGGVTTVYCNAQGYTGP